MLAHKVDGENPAGCSDLLLATWKLQRRAEARDPLAPKTPVTSGSNVICSQTPGNLFASCKLKGTCTFTTWTATIGNAEGEADSGMKQEEMEPLADEQVKAFRWSRRNRSAYGVYCLLHQGSQTILTEKQKLFQVQESWPPHVGLPKRHQQITWKADLNTKEGMAKKGGQATQKSATAQQTSLEETSQT